MNRIEIQITAGAYLAAAAWVLLLPLGWVAAALLSAAVHELGHLAALRLMGIRVYTIRVGPTGARITTGAMSWKEELLCSAAGPAASFLLTALICKFPLLAIWGLIQGCFNLLPFYPMDGGRMIRSMYMILAEKWQNKKNTLQRSNSASTI